MGGISIWQLLIIAVIVVLLFGTNKLRTLGSDLGASIKGFKKAIGDEDKTPPSTNANNSAAPQDADFKSLSEQQPEVKKEESKSQNKEQV
ncbi:TatA family twin-arginine translocation protein [Hafnia paralvei ATCC 29927]|jgi:sec-independent protein translocase protein TatA|uniref:Sec-independent protein translocase protein TatA n=2 Tax=Hafnia TaxID=568 RepID=A0A2A2M8D9_9GAMM|nr:MULTISPECIES: Sec-independent protein translocase subunit TatA [Hafnia]AJR01609.1 Twin-arginine translocation protein TatA [Enterobacteriaceae bacterium bta3-1]MDU1192235.1 Sec-independent protein translocase subunit TatA [Enterobacteriaceae bacterium]AMH17180.1 twin-arginine translocase TatA/TatE family subunit [Hafnia paralvei]EHM48266.1 twin arginine-targeting protein translocase, TatA/E family [Hafnia alvei ATCC 51873]KHS42094.1 preprotein translocase subunit TatA [Hafnia paralvei]